MKKTKTGSKLHIAFIVIMFAGLISLIAALCLFDYNFKTSLEEMWQANMPSLILAGVCVVLNLVIAISAIVLRVKNNELTRSEVTLAFQITAILVVEIALCVPIFIMWIIEKIHDAISYRRHKQI